MGNFKCIFHRKTWRFIASFWLLLCCSQVANSADYYWKLDLNGSIQPEVYSDGFSACASLNQRFAGNGRNYYGKFESSTAVECWDQLGSTRFAGRRFGDSCPAGTEFDSVTTKCLPPPNPCADKPPMPFSKSGTAPDGYMKVITVGGKPKAIQSTEGCFSGCMASTTDQKCTTKASGPYFCQGTAYFDGQTCDVAGTPGVDSSSSAEYPQTEDTKETKPCNYQLAADGTKSCVATENTEKEGQVCGTVSATGQQICVDKQPTKNGLSIASVVKTETLPDGTTQTTKTDTATVTKCTGILDCKTSTTTVTTVSNGNGTVSSSCKGENCPDKNTNPDADGDGFGDCVKGPCGDGEEEGGNISGEEGCDVPLICEGDAIQCAMVRQQKMHRCADEEFRTVNDKKIQETKGIVDAAFAGEEYQPLKVTQDGTFDMSSMIDTSRHFSSACPTVPDWNIPWLDSTSVVIPISDVISQWCEYLVWFGYILVAFAMRGAAEIIARGLS